VRAVLSAQTEGSEFRVSAIEVGTLGGEVSLGALNALASKSSICVGIVEASEPSGTDIGSKRPLTNPDLVFDLFSHAHVLAIAVAEFANVTLAAPPGEVLVSIHHNVLVIVIGEQIVPGVGIKVEGVVEAELDAGLLFLHHGANFSVEVLENIEVRGPPWLVNGLNGVNSLMLAPSV